MAHERGAWLKMRLNIGGGFVCGAMDDDLQKKPMPTTLRLSAAPPIHFLSLSQHNKPSSHLSIRSSRGDEQLLELLRVRRRRDLGNEPLTLEIDLNLLEDLHLLVVVYQV